VAGLETGKRPLYEEIQAILTVDVLPLYHCHCCLEQGRWQDDAASTQWKGDLLNQAYWENVCKNYDTEVLSVWDRDRDGVIRQKIETLAETLPAGASVADFGCGVGKFLPLLTRHFDAVEACDYSLSGLERAKQTKKESASCELRFHQLDFSVDPVPFVPVDVVLCINVLLVACFDTRMRCWRTVTNQVASGGWLLLVVPSLESILMQQHLERESLLQSGQGCETSLHDCMPDGSTAIDLHQGVHLLEGFRTKHYFKEELVHLLSEHHFEKIEIRRLEYRPVGDKYQSWDWFVCARRTVVD